MIKKIKYLYEISLFKTVYFNFKYLGIKGIKLPVLLSKNIYLKNLKGKINIKNNNFGEVKLGFSRVGIIDSKYNRFIFENTGEINFLGKENLGSGVKICNAGNIEFGENFDITGNTSIVCFKKISFGKNVLISWDNTIMDTDFHKIKNLETDICLNNDKEILIGENVWIGFRNTILKGVIIGNNTVISSNNLITGNFESTENIIIGDKNKIIKQNIYWER